MVTGRRERVLPDALGGDLEDPRVHRVEEVRRLHDAGDPVVDVVVDEERPEQRLLRLDVVRQRVGFGVERPRSFRRPLSALPGPTVIAGPRAPALAGSGCG